MKCGYPAQFKVLSDRLPYKIDYFIIAVRENIMRIDSKDKISNISILSVRNALRRMEDSFDKSSLEYKLQISGRKASSLLKELVRAGYLVNDNSGKTKGFYKKTTYGNAFCLSTAAKPISRVTADKHLKQFMERVHNVNKDLRFLYKVNWVRVFGSYLSDKEMINDVDLALEIDWKKNHPKVKGKKISEVALQHFIDSNEGSQNIINQLGWPEREVKKYLKSRSRVISLHFDDKIIDNVKSKLIFRVID